MVFFHPSNMQLVLHCPVRSCDTFARVRCASPLFLSRSVFPSVGEGGETSLSDRGNSFEKLITDYHFPNFFGSLRSLQGDVGERETSTKPLSFRCDNPRRVVREECGVSVPGLKGDDGVGGTGTHFRGAEGHNGWDRLSGLEEARERCRKMGGPAETPSGVSVTNKKRCVDLRVRAEW
jgi:hypothetical protein